MVLGKADVENSASKTILEIFSKFRLIRHRDRARGW